MAVSVLPGCANDGGGADIGVDAPSSDGGLTPSAACDRYLTCFKAVDPDKFDEELKLFEAGSSCWKSASSSANCEKACQTGYDDLAKKHTTVKVCGGTPPDGYMDQGRDLGALEPTGNACKVDIECTGGLCLDKLTDAGKEFTMTGGYCSRDCSTKTCKAGEACFRNTDSTGKTLSQVCLRVCAASADCRTSEDYTCSAMGVCMPDTGDPP